MSINKVVKAAKVQQHLKGDSSIGSMILPIKKNKIQNFQPNTQKLLSSKSMKAIKESKPTRNEELIKMILNKRE